MIHLRVAAVLLAIATGAAAAQAPDPPIPLPEHWETTYVMFIEGNPAFVGPDADRRSLLLAHYQYQLGLLADGHARTGGPLVAEPGDRILGITLLTATSLDEALALASADPAVRAGLLRTTVRTWTTPANRPARDVRATEQAVVAAIQAFFRAMTARDVEASRRVMVDEGQLFSVRPGPDGPVLRRMSHEQYFEFLARGTGTLIERMWDATVLVDQDVALLWTPYDIFHEGDFLHCGVNGFMLVRSAEGWQIAGAIYTVEPDGCAPSPLGPLGEEHLHELRLVPASERTRYDVRLQAERHAVLARVHAELRAMAKGDVEASRGHHVPQAHGIRVRRTPNGPEIDMETLDEYWAWLREKDYDVVERIWDEIVFVHGPIAVVWAPYDFYREGTLSHCGTNVIALVHTEGEWKIGDWMWNVRPENCPPSPLGPLGR